MEYLRNTWYAVAWSDEIGDQPFGRKVIEDPLVIYRTADGELHVLRDMCPHRFAPLSKGKIISDQLQCPYHGLRFNSNGQCVFNPHGDGVVPKAAVTRTYPVLEKFGLVWVWMGQKAADPAKLPNFDFMDDTRWTYVKGHIHGSGYYELFTDNILDLGHAAFLHTGLSAPAFTIGKRHVFQDGDTVWSNVSHPNDFISDIMNNMFNSHGKRFDAWTDVQWTAPGSMSLLSYYAEPGTPKEDGHMHTSIHVMTPESPDTTHYFWAFGRDIHPDNEEFSAKLRAGIEYAFEEEDKPMIALQQAQVGDRDIMSMRPVLLAGDAGDAGAVRARRMLRKLIAQEQSNGEEASDQKQSVDA